jgi:hypothetical protein
MGPSEVGFKFERIKDPSTSREILLMIWYPTADDVSNKEIAEYPQYLSPSVSVPFSLPAEYYRPYVEGKLVYQSKSIDINGSPIDGVSVEPGLHPVLVHLPGGGAPGFIYIYEGVKFASHGFIFISVTHSPVTPGVRGQLERDAKYILDQLLSWNQTEGNPFHQTINPEAIFGGGHSLGGRTWLARTSLETEFQDLLTEVRIKGLAVKDATREALTVGQCEKNFTPTFLNSQFCRNTQISLQQDLGSKPKMLTLEALPTDPALPGRNHAMFSQTCKVYYANKDNGHPLDAFVRPLDRINCQNPDYVYYEDVHAKQTTKYNIAYLKTLMGEAAYHHILAPGQVTDPGVYLIQTGLGEGGDETIVFNSTLVQGAEGFCNQPSEDPGENPIMEW